MNKPFFIIGCLLAADSIFMGAVAAHTLEKTLSPKAFHNFETAAKYQVIASFFMVIVAIAIPFVHTKIAFFSGWIGFAGVVLFSGSLYIYSMTEIKFLVYITPFGGLLMITGWLLLAFAAIKKAPFMP